MKSTPLSNGNGVPTDPRTHRLELPDALGYPSLQVDMEAFFEFSFWIAEELEDLVAEHKHRDAMRDQVAAARSRVTAASRAK